MEESTHQPERAERFITAIVSRCGKDKGFAARLKRADNPATEYQSWDILAQFHIKLEREYERLPFALIGAAVARAQLVHDGCAGLGECLRGCFSEKELAESRLRRLLACDSTEELCRVLRPLLALLAKSTRPLCYGRLLGELCWFSTSAQRIKLRWAQAFYGYADVQTEDGQEE